jgi:hypothetical protein
MSRLTHLNSIPIDEWPQLYQRAIAAGSGLTIDPELERVSAADELVALTLPELVRLAALALIADGPTGPRTAPTRPDTMLPRYCGCSIERCLLTLATPATRSTPGASTPASTRSPGSASWSRWSRTAYRTPP